MENYVLIWDINHGRWHKEWASNPDGATDRFGPAQAERLKQLNQLRIKIVQPLYHFANKVTSAHTPRELALAVYELLEEVQASQALRAAGGTPGVAGQGRGGIHSVSHLGVVYEYARANRVYAARAFVGFHPIS